MGLPPLPTFIENKESRFFKSLKRRQSVRTPVFTFEMEPRLLQVVFVIVLWAESKKQGKKKQQSFYYRAHASVCVRLQRVNSAVILTVSIGVFSRGRLSPPGVSVGLKETERFPGIGVAVGTVNLCTGGTVDSI